MKRLFATWLTVLLVALWSSGTFVSARCECSHGPEIECECPHHQGGAEDDESLPPCHRAAAQQARKAKAERAEQHPGATFKNKCGASASEWIQTAVAVTEPPPEVPSGPSAELEPRWALAPGVPRDVRFTLDPPPPRV